MKPPRPDVAPAVSDGEVLLTATDTDRALARARLAEFRAALRRARPDIEARLFPAPGTPTGCGCVLPLTETTASLLRLAHRHGLAPALPDLAVTGVGAR